MKAVISNGKATRQQLAAAVTREFTKYVMEVRGGLASAYSGR
jgi:hypothetical protein